MHLIATLHGSWQHPCPWDSRVNAGTRLRLPGVLCLDVWPRWDPTREHPHLPLYSLIQPASSLPTYGSARLLAGSPCLRSLSLVGTGVGEQSKHPLDTTRRVWAGNAEPPAAARTPTFYQGPVLPQMSRSDARKSESC